MQKRFSTYVQWVLSAILFLSFGCSDRGSKGNLPPDSSGGNIDATPPSVVSTIPANSAVDVLLTSTISVVFSEPIDCATITTDTFTLRTFGSVDKLGGSVTCSGTTAVFTPAADFIRGEIYLTAVTSDVTDLAGNHLINTYSWPFTATRAPSQLFHDYVVIPTGAAGAYAVAIGDVNADGRNDVVLTTSFYFDFPNDYKLKVYLQNAEGALEQPLVYSLTEFGSNDDVAIGDINNDGKNEVIIANPYDGIRVLAQDGSGGFAIMATYTTDKPGLIRLADMNGDGLLDIVGIYTVTQPNKVVVFFQNSNGTLDPAKSYDVIYGSFSDLDVGDVNGDGRPDIVIMSGEGNTEICVLLQNSDGTYGPVLYYFLAEELSSRDGIVIGDVTGDSLADIIYARGANEPNSLVDIMFQNSDHTMDSYVVYSSYDLVGTPKIADVSLDGRNDIIVLHRGWFALGVYPQDEDGTLLQEELYEIPDPNWEFHALAVGDINNDGLPDAVIASDPAGLVVLYHK